MSDTQKSTVIALTILLAMFLQVMLVFADQADAPGRAAVRFVKAYYALDPSMRTLLCQAAQKDEEADRVDEFLSRVADQARARGFDPAYMRSKVLHAESRTVFSDANTATVTVTGVRKRMIHPFFTWVAQIFFLGETYPFEETLQLVKEDGRWKVCQTELPPPAV